MSDQEASSSSNTVDDTTPALQTLVEAILAESGNPDGMREELLQITARTDQSGEQRLKAILTATGSSLSRIISERHALEARDRQERDITTQSRGTMTDRWDPLDFTRFCEFLERPKATGRSGAMTEEEKQQRRESLRKSLRKWVDGWKK